MIVLLGFLFTAVAQDRPVTDFDEEEVVCDEVTFY